MEGNGTLKERLVPWLSRLSRYRFAALVALLGIGLMLLPGRSEHRAASRGGERSGGGRCAGASTADLCRQLEADAQPDGRRGAR